MRAFTETFSDRQILVEVKDPYIFALEFMDASKQFGKIVEKENEVLASGAGNDVKVRFDVVKAIDNNSRAVVDVSIGGRYNSSSGTLQLKMHGFLRVVFMNDEGIMQETFGEFYHRNLVPELRKISRVRVNDIMKKLEKSAKELSKNFKP